MAVIEPLVLHTGQAARLCGVSASTWRRMSNEGRCPAPVYLGTLLPVWIRTELVSWLHSGAPDRETWEKMKESSK